MTEPRRVIIELLADFIAAQPCDQTLCVGIDGRSASGKTVLADELVEPVEQRGRPVIRASIDGFHQPRAMRYANGDGPEHYYRDSFNLPAVRECVLDPLGPTGDGSYRSAVFDFRTDQPVTVEPIDAPANAVLLFEGVFLFQPKLNDAWDVRILVEADIETTITRALVRDADLMGGADAVRRRYDNRYVLGQQIYRDASNPVDQADVIVMNDDPANPQLQWAVRHTSNTQPSC